MTSCRVGIPSMLVNVPQNWCEWKYLGAVSFLGAIDFSTSSSLDVFWISARGMPPSLLLSP